MENSNAHRFTKIIADFEALMKKAPDMVGIIAVELFKESFVRKGQIMGTGVKPWPEMGGHPKSRSPGSLEVKSGQYRRSIQYRKHGRRVRVSSDEAYAQIQNDGGSVPVTTRMRKFFWAMYKQTDDEFWKGMALTKKAYITIKPRPVIYDTPELGNRLDNKFIPLIKQIISQ